MTVLSETLVLKRPNDRAIRRTERLLLLISAVFIGANFLALSIVNASTPFNWIHFLVWMVCASLGTMMLDHYLPGRDPLLFPVVMLLSGWGLILIDRLAPNFADRQTIWLCIALVALLLVACLPHPLRWLRQYRYSLLLIGILLLVGTIILGRNPSGLVGAPQLWLGIGSVFFQPSEALKIILVAFLASYLAEQYPAVRSQVLRPGWVNLSPRIFGPIVLMWGVCLVILVWQRDLGTAILFFTVFMLLLYVASGQGFILGSGFVLVVLAGIAGYFAFPVVRLRVDIWLNPWPEADGRAYQIVQSLLAFAAGGIFGQGVAQGSPTYIPVVHSDFAFSAVAEEWGLLGIITVIICLALIITRGFQTAVTHHKRAFLALLATGLSLVIAMQSLLIMGGVLKLVPLTGVTLPFLSYGGSSLLASFVMVGLLLRLSALESST
jgi:cell division protein FtsW (lipid II flippase)